MSVEKQITHRKFLEVIFKSGTAIEELDLSAWYDDDHIKHFFIAFYW